jgi:hypothetical protein
MSQHSIAGFFGALLPAIISAITLTIHSQPSSDSDQSG